MIGHSFVKRIARLLTGQHAIELMTMHIWWAFAAQAAASIYSGYKSSQALKKGGQAASDAAYANAADLRDLASFNSEGYRAAGGVNASAIRTVGEANAIAVENATSRNMLMYGIQADEDRRRHVIQERNTAGSIRAMAGASGIQTNTGSPLHYLNSQVMLGIQERRFGDIKAYWTLRNMFEEGTEKAGVIRLTASQQAGVTEFNANLQADMAYAEAMRQATAMERSGSVSAATGAAQGSAAMWGGISNAVGSIGAAYQSFGGLTPTSNTGAYNYGGSGYTQTSSWGSSASDSGWFVGGGVDSKPFSSAYF